MNRPTPLPDDCARSQLAGLSNLRYNSERENGDVGPYIS